MVQRRKDEVQAVILSAALRVFAQRGYAAAKMAEIAAVASISAGNIYLYFASKEELFAAIVPTEFVLTLTRRMLRKVAALEETRDIDRLAPGAPYLVLSEDLLEFLLANRLRVVILLGRARGTNYEGFGAQTVERLKRLALAYHAKTRPDAPVTETMRFALHQIYQNLLAAIVDTFASYDDERKIREVHGQLSAYHLAGMRRLFDTAPSSARLSRRKLG